MKTITFVAALLLTACVTINIYFPAAAAEKVADKIIQDIQTEQPKEKLPGEIPQSGLSKWQISFFQGLDQLFSVIMTPAYADADLKVETPEIRRIRTSMRTRFAALSEFYNKGYVGIKTDGLLAVRGSVPLKDRNRVKRLVIAENSDRNRLYQAIANANGHPQWFAQIKSTFASRWVGNAHYGWWYQSSHGVWKQK